MLDDLIAKVKAANNGTHPTMGMNEQNAAIGLKKIDMSLQELRHSARKVIQQGIGLELAALLGHYVTCSSRTKKTLAKGANAVRQTDLIDRNTPLVESAPLHCGVFRLE